MKNLLLPLLAIFFLASVAIADDLPPRLDITLDRFTMWTRLPPEVSTATQGPDGRVWLAVRSDSTPTRDRFEALLQREFSEKMPQFRAPLLFEPNERIWFDAVVSHNNETQYTLFGYNGNTLIELSLNARMHLRPSAAFANEKAFFASLNGIHVYDGQQWSTRDVPPLPPNQNERVLPYRLFTEPDGKGVIAVPRQWKNPLLRWRDGNWTEFPLNDNQQTNATTASAAPRNDGIWLLRSNGLSFFNYQTNTLTPSPLFGKYRLQYVNLLLTLPNGSTLVAAKNVLGEGRNNDANGKPALLLQKRRSSIFHQE